MQVTIKRGLDIPILGEPEPVLDAEKRVESVALVGRDYVGLRTAMQVEEGDQVKLGQTLFTDKKNPGFSFTAPAAGRVLAINRGAKRILDSVVIQLSGDDEESFASYGAGELTGLSREQVRDNLTSSGLWTSFRTRPFSKIPAPESVPSSIFVTAIDSNPLAASPEVVIGPCSEDFVAGLSVLPKLTDGKVFVCQRPGAEIPTADDERIVVAEFRGPHPAGLPGTHIHHLDPVSAQKTVWHVGYQDVIAIGKLFTTGRLWTERTVALGGPILERPRLVRTRVGANLEDLVGDEVPKNRARIVSGSPLSGHQGVGPLAFLGRYHNQVCALVEGGRASFRAFLGWLAPGPDKYSLAHVFVSSLAPRRKFNLSTLLNGEKRAIFPYGAYEEVMPLDILPTQLLRALAVEDTETAVALGALELDEEDLALCSFVCPSKYDYGPFLRANLEIIEKEG
ncbi:MAG: Na(+)-translocating NADH-quinone reductase subunit A [Myxococcota bacterium]|nr:Na(+)-translocating NADH-quinone reductase subunit A [Myxococcota bacterium]